MFVDVDLPGNVSEDDVRTATAKASEWAREVSGWNWRIYRTHAGVRLLATHELISPTNPLCQRAFEFVGADPDYVRLCTTHECFRARLTPKPWRCGVPRPPGRWPFTNADEERHFLDWKVSYDAVCDAKATCQLLTVGNGDVHQSLLPLVILHDRETRALSRFPLA